MNIVTKNKINNKGIMCQIKHKYLIRHIIPILFSITTYSITIIIIIWLCKRNNSSSPS